ncbi:unnamed protein product [Kuraishia capsulata CBS 1993]|uniref:Autophagy-related protein 18 n=1 Tax=Kuraishia capsulata CBS 1993 TaxID=1382522 RepID=W6MMA7_9ASCO|nr:uncharacterized protein KUCA_T00003650001 [Kuraishia capsulata CBS 1993]CDK27671.1 unnamed protein product [Kuraishia capsulata CBS 1993]
MAEKYGNPNYLKYMNFNQDYTCVSVGFEKSYKLFNCEPFGECFSKNDDGGAGIAEMLFATSLVAIVGLGDKPATSPRKLKIINTKRKSVICELVFPSLILSVRLNRKRLVVFVQDQIYIYDVSCMKLLHTIEISPHKLAIGDLSSSDESILAFPSPGENLAVPPRQEEEDLESDHIGNSSFSEGDKSKRPRQGSEHITGNNGTVVLFDALNLQPLEVIQAHKSPIQKLTLSKDGTLLATASAKGTIIRVFRVSDGRRLYEFRRGTYNAVISGLSFNLENTILTCCSLTGTIHFFKLDEGSSSTLADADREYDLKSYSSDSNVEDDMDEDRTDSSVPDLENNDGDEPTKRKNSKTNYYDSLKELGKKSGFKDMLWSSISKNVRGKVNDYLPSKVTSMLEPKRDFAFIKLPHAIGENATTERSSNVEEVLRMGSSHSIASIAAINTPDSTVMVVTADGNFYVYTLPGFDKGGACILVKQYKLYEE